MLSKTIEEIESRLADAHIPADHKTDLLRLLETLKGEISDLAETHQEHAQSITGFASVSTHEAIRSEKNPDLLKYAISGMSESVAEFEKSHPRLVEIVNSIATTLSNLGI